MPLPLQEACQVCAARAGAASDVALFKCSRCQAVLYCGRAHQSADFAAHKAVCKRVHKMRAKMAEEADKIRSAREDDWTPGDAFETGVGRFWGLVNTRPYMRAKLEVIRALSSIAARPAIEAALAEARDCLRLCRSDNLGIREVVPTLMLLLGQYQEAYDIIKWYTTSGTARDYDWANMDLPFLDIHGADMTEELPSSLMRGREVFFSSALVYIKMQLRNAVRDAITAYNVADRASLPAPLAGSLGDFLAPNANGQRQSLADLEALHEQLHTQMEHAFSMAHFQNQHYWTAMLDPTPIANSPKPPHYAPGDENQVRLWVQPNAILWRDHHAYIRERREDYPDFLPEMPQRGPKMLHNYH